jgi:RHS repeat-associated protein
LLATQGRVLQLASDYLYSVATLVASTETATVAAPWMATDVSGNYYYILREWYEGVFADSVRKYSTTLPKDDTSGTIIIPTNGELYIFDKKGRHLRTLDALTQIVKYEFGYTGGGLLSVITDGYGNVTTIERAAGGTPVAIVSSSGQRTALGIDSNGWLASVTDPGNSTYSMAYRAGGLLEKFIHPDGFYGYMTYDDLGRLVRDGNSKGDWKELSRTTNADGSDTITVTNSDGTSRTMTFGGSGGAAGSTFVGYDGATTRVEYNADGSYTTYSSGGSVHVLLKPDVRFGMLEPYVAYRYEYLAGGAITRTTRTQEAEFLNSADPLSLLRMKWTVTEESQRYDHEKSEWGPLTATTSSSEYDARTRTHIGTSPMGRQTFRTIDAMGRDAATQVAGIEPVYSIYDEQGNLKAMTQGSGVNQRQVSYVYRSDGQIESATDALGRTVVRSYDESGKLASRTLPGGRMVSYRYDASGNMVGFTPPSKPEFLVHYTSDGLIAGYEPPPVSGVENSSTTFQYDADGQRTGLTRPDERTVRFNYDSDGQLQALDTSVGRYEATYNTEGNITVLSAPGDELLSYSYDESTIGERYQGTVNGQVVWNYDEDSRLTAQTVNDVSEVSFAYDADDLLTRAGSLSLTNDAQSGLPTGTTLGQVTDSQIYNNFGEIAAYSVNASGNTLFNVSYIRDKASRIVDKSETVEGVTAVYHYDYDEAGRLTDVTRDGVSTAHYEYDDNGNRTLAQYPGTALSGTYDGQDRMLTYGANTYSYTANGELLEEPVAGGLAGYGYDVLGNLRSAMLPGGIEIEYVLDALGRRVGKKVNSVPVQGFLYDGQLQIVAELDGEGKVVSRFVYSGSSNVPDYMVRDGKEYRIVADHRGSPRLVIDAEDGNIVQRIDYDEFGNITEDTNPGFQPFGFAGGLYDLDTGLVHFGAREYDSHSGRWTAKDPILFAGGTNLYRYAGNDPVNQKDPTGLICIDGLCDTPAEAAKLGFDMIRGKSWRFQKWEFRWQWLESGWSNNALRGAQVIDIYVFSFTEWGGLIKKVKDKNGCEKFEAMGPTSGKLEWENTLLNGIRKIPEFIKTSQNMLIEWLTGVDLQTPCAYPVGGWGGKAVERDMRAKDIVATYHTHPTDRSFSDPDFLMDKMKFVMPINGNMYMSTIQLESGSGRRVCGW